MKFSQVSQNLADFYKKIGMHDWWTEKYLTYRINSHVTTNNYPK